MALIATFFALGHARKNDESELSSFFPDGSHFHQKRIIKKTEI
jgi:hypothetical protein